MNLNILLAVRIFFAVFLLFFGANKFFHFVDPPPPPSDEAVGYWVALMSSKTMSLVAVVEIAAGLSLILNKYGALMMVILMSVSLNAVLYHIAFDIAQLPMAGVLILLNIFMLYSYRANYKELLN